MPNGPLPGDIHRRARSLAHECSLNAEPIGDKDDSWTAATFGYVSADGRIDLRGRLRDGLSTGT